ncbi:single-stranded-DNA-specific exonuclease RecJ [Natribacillus halophilus]|uniref:Single-stranded-DNA-specific exonuclease RecJ n=1 Tax=Natribacillus halophilus TaxID=549003 RepID=A0A1G8NYQ8_9BACI|nr:single-stranded-DNA-specific exonuclease RecJ [Natribacillus halophilus]SDI85431.1 exonuclease RecJ [Natribacillus halophilus]
MLDAKTRWHVHERDEDASALAAALQVTERTAHLLCRRGLRQEDEARAFLHTNPAVMHDPFLLAGMEAAVNRMSRAISENEKIVVFGDYDVDGVSSTALMCETLAKLGADYDYYIPNRFTEGYGLNSMALQRLHEDGARLVITVDTGISSQSPVDDGNEMGLDVIVTDHHEAPPELPAANAIINPKRQDCPYPFKELAGVGVVSKLAHALLGEFPLDGLDLLALGTISDLVPLVDENRFFAQSGLQTLGHLERPGLQALKELSGISGPPFSAETVGFGFGPRLNAAGRMDAAGPAVQLLLTADMEKAQALAETIDGYNRERQQTVDNMTKEALVHLEGAGDHWAIVVAGRGWNSGVTGIVASRLVEKYYRPTIVIALDEEGNGKGSARSIEGLDLYDALSRHRQLFQKFGGHRMAAGLSIHEDDISALRDALNEEAQKSLSPEDLVPTTNIELELDVDDINVDLLREIEQLAPFGVGNPKPLVTIANVPIQQKRKIGSDKNHVKMAVGEPQRTLDCIGFRFGYLDDEINGDANIHLVGTLDINEWKGQEKPQLVVKDVAVKERQLFDVRGRERLPSLVSGDRPMAVVIFQPEHEKEAIAQGFSSSDVVWAGEESLTTATDIFFFDLPNHLADLEHFLTSNERFIRSIYTGFMEKSSTFFMTKPTREAFKWFYIYLKKYAPLHLHDHEPTITRYQGWSRDTIQFMVQVFTELEFVSVRDGQLTVNDKPLKQDLNASPTFYNYEEKQDIEQTLKFSNYQALKQFLFACMPLEKKRVEVLTDGL